ncbi:MAG TPA: hypothetical protein VFT87_01100 [Candidatus Saccharimonadales bacterium]|nr:hypothetical protein [Candidatus Saccharimonadales bacterium]
MTLEQYNPIPPKGCTCGALWSVRGRHGKPDCPYMGDNPSSGEVEGFIQEFVVRNHTCRQYFGDKELLPCTFCEVKSKLTKLLLEQRIEEIRLMAKYVRTSPFAYPELAGGFANNYMNGRLTTIKAQLNQLNKGDQ